MNEPSRYTGLILAGGDSRRFGSDKAVYTVDGRSMIDRVHAAVSPVVSDMLIAGGTSRSTAAYPPARLVADEPPGVGPLGGLRAGLAAARTPWVLTVACDMPYLTTTALRRLARCCEDAVEAVIAVDSTGRLHPLCAVYRGSLLDHVDRRIASRTLSMHGFVAAIDARHVTLPADALRNVNARDDLT